MVININQSQNMCGIILHANLESKSKTPVNGDVLSQYEDQYSRGTQGFGMVFVNENREFTVRRATEAQKMLMDMYTVHAPIILFHHRAPTSSRNKIDQTHPILVNNPALEYVYYIVHNGHVSNDDELKDIHEKAGFKYTTERDLTEHTIEFNDSESLAIEAALFIEKKIDKIRARGGAAIAGIRISKRDDLVSDIFFGRDLGALKMSAREGELRVASEGKGHDIPEKQITMFNLANKTKMTIPFELSEYVAPPSAHRHFPALPPRGDNGPIGFQPKTSETVRAILQDPRSHNPGLPKSSVFTIPEIIEKIRKVRATGSRNKLLSELRMLFGNKITTDDCIYFMKDEKDGGPKAEEIMDICKMIEKNEIMNLTDFGGIAIIAASQGVTAESLKAVLNMSEVKLISNIEAKAKEDVTKMFEDEYLTGCIAEIQSAVEDPAILFSFEFKEIMGEFAEQVKKIINQAKSRWTLAHQQEAEIVANVISGFDDDGKYLTKKEESKDEENNFPLPPPPPVASTLKEEKRHIPVDTVSKWIREMDREDAELREMHAAELDSIEQELHKQDGPIVVRKMGVIVEQQSLNIPKKDSTYIPASIRMKMAEHEALRQSKDDEDIYEPTIAALDAEYESQHHPDRDLCDMPPRPKRMGLVSMFG